MVSFIHEYDSGVPSLEEISEIDMEDILVPGNQNLLQSKSPSPLKGVIQPKMNNYIGDQLSPLNSKFNKVGLTEIDLNANKDCAVDLHSVKSWKTEHNRFETFDRQHEKVERVCKQPKFELPPEVRADLFPAKERAQ